MMVLICYDVQTLLPEGRKRLRRVARICENYGQRVQNSVFECILDPAQWTMVQASLLKEVNLEEDSLRFYYLGKNWRKRVDHHGVKLALDPEGPLIV